MHILGVPSFYPTSWQPNNGTFFRSHFQALRRAGLTVGVAYCEGRALRRDFTPANLGRYHFQTACAEEDGLVTLRRYGWDTLTKTPAGGVLWAHLLAGTIAAYIRQVGRPDIVHAHQAQWAGYAARLIARRYGIPYIITEHSHYYFDGHLLQGIAPCLREAFAHADAVVAVSRALATAMAPYTGGRPIHVIPNPVDTDLFTLAAPRAAAGHRLLAVGRLTREKRFDLLLQAVAELADDLPELTLTLLGEGPEREALTAQCRHAGLAERVALPGAVPAAGVREAMQTADALVLSSDMETFGTVLVEAMAVGLPVVATACGGPDDIVTEDVGVLVPRGDARALAAGLRRVLAGTYDPRAIRAHAERQFSYPGVAAACRAVYDEVLSARVCATRQK